MLEILTIILKFLFLFQFQKEMFASKVDSGMGGVSGGGGGGGGVGSSSGKNKILLEFFLNF